MLSTNTAYDTKNAELYKWPLYTIEIDGVAQKLCNHIPVNPTGQYYRYLDSISGLAQTVKPEQGTATIGNVRFILIDVNNAITNIISNHASNLHRAKTVVKAGYKGMDESDLLTIATYWITDCKRPKDSNKWMVSASDPQKWLQKKIYRTATEENPIELSGNPINILLQILTSSDSGTNSDYDLGDADFGCGLDSTTCDIAGIERIRDSWYWGDSHNMKFTINEKFKAKEFIEKEILKVLNCYPGVTGDGKYKIIRFQPPMATGATVQDFSEDKILNVPALDLNFKETINQIDFFYDHDTEDDEFGTEQYYIDSASYNARGNAAKPLKIESKGIHTDVTNAAYIINKRKNVIFQRYATPPIKIKASCFFFFSASEAGDIVKFTHSKVPNVGTGETGLSEEWLEIVRKSVDWKNGKVNIDFLQTGFGKGTYSVVSPSMEITAASSGTAFTVSTTDAAKWTAGWEAKIVNQQCVEQATVTILTVDTDTGAITCDDIGQTPAAGWHVVFADYDDVTADQKLYSYMADTNDYLGAANDAAHLIVA